MKKLLIPLAIIIISITILTLTILRNKSTELKQAELQKQAELLNKIQVVNEVPSLEVTNVRIKYASDERNALAILEIKNNSDKPIVAMTIESRNKTSASGISSMGGVKDGLPSAIFKPHESSEKEFPIASIIPGCPIKIAAVIYADGTGDGEADALSSLSEGMEKDKNRLKEFSKSH